MSYQRFGNCFGDFHSGFFLNPQPLTVRIAFKENIFPFRSDNEIKTAEIQIHPFQISDAEVRYSFRENGYQVLQPIIISLPPVNLALIRFHFLRICPADCSAGHLKYRELSSKTEKLSGASPRFAFCTRTCRSGTARLSERAGGVPEPTEHKRAGGVPEPTEHKRH